MLTPYVPYPPSSGGQVRTLNLLKYLSKNNKITLVCLYKDPKEKGYYRNLKKYCQEIYFCARSPSPWQLKNILRTIFSSYPFLVVRNFSNEAQQLLKTLLEKENFDIIHAETFYIMPHLPKTKIPIFLLEQTIEYRVYEHFVNSLPLFLRPLFFYDVIKLKKTEVEFWKKANLVGAVSQDDAMIIDKLIHQSPVIIPNAAGDEMVVNKLPKKNLGNPIILFQGNFFWLQNTEAANYLIKKIIPLSKRIIKKANFLIAGQNATKKLKINQVICSNLEIYDINDNNINLVKEIYQKSTLFISPIFGPGGTRLKILAAMAMGLPIISTSIGVSGLDVEDGREVLIAENEEQFIIKINKILQNEKLYYALQKNAHRLAKEKYSWSVVAEKLENIYHRLLS
jgi:glycosyltransferase involved in cell wall biosynthesis